MVNFTVLNEGEDDKRGRLTLSQLRLLDKYGASREEDYKRHAARVGDFNLEVGKEELLKGFEKEVNGRFLVGNAVAEGVSDNCHSTELGEVRVELEDYCKVLSNATLFRFFRSDNFYSDIITHCGDDKLSVILDEKGKMYFSGKISKEDGLENFSEEYDKAKFVCSSYLDGVRWVLDSHLFSYRDSVDLVKDDKGLVDSEKYVAVSSFDDPLPVEVSGERLVDGKRVLYEMTPSNIEVHEGKEAFDNFQPPLYE